MQVRAFGCSQSHCAAANFSDASFLAMKWLNLARKGPCVTSHPGFTPHLNSWVLDTYFRTQKVNWKRQPKLARRNRRLSTE